MNQNAAQGRGGRGDASVRRNPVMSSGKNLWTGAGTSPCQSPNLNTWNGPIIQGVDGTHHLFVPVCLHASLWKVIYYAHGTAAKIEGPYDWSSPNISATAVNPAALVFQDSTGKLVYSLWIGGDIWVAADSGFYHQYTHLLSFGLGGC